MRAPSFQFLMLVFLVFSLILKPCFAESDIVVPVSSEVDIEIETFPSTGKYLILWLAPEYGLRRNHRFMASKLTEENIEVWLGNIAESLFLPQTTGSLKQLDGKYVAKLIDYAHQQTGKKIIVAGDSYAALNVLLGIHHWQYKTADLSYLIGAILFSPSLYAYVPSLGLPAEFLPIASATNIPIMIYQGQKSGNVTQFKPLLEELQKNDSAVYFKFIPNIRSLFYAQEPSKEMIETIKLLSPNIRKMITLLESHTFPDKPIALKVKSLTNPLTTLTKGLTNKENKSGIDTAIKEFKGNFKPSTIELHDAYGNSYSKNDYKGQITIVNFWATWCPPCVKEIPSLNRLKKKMSDYSFELISINYAEDNKTILSFMEKVNVEFPVLLDLDGKFAAKWNVITYPSTFIIGPNGKIKYGINAAIEWDDAEVIEQIKSLL
jgi:thiol-disulfide isomerase/thioredoxin